MSDCEMHTEWKHSIHTAHDNAVCSWEHYAIYNYILFNYHPSIWKCVWAHFGRGFISPELMRLMVEWFEIRIARHLWPEYLISAFCTMATASAMALLSFSLVHSKFSIYMQHSHLNVEMNMKILRILCCRTTWNACFVGDFSVIPSCLSWNCVCVVLRCVGFAIAHLRGFKFFIQCGSSTWIVDCCYHNGPFA